MARIRVLIRKRMVSAEMYIAAVTLKLMSMINGAQSREADRAVSEGILDAVIYDA